MDLKNRLFQFVRYLGISKSEFERNVGLSNGFINKTGENTRFSTLDKISKIYPELNISWLKTGEGNMLRVSVDDMSYNEILDQQLAYQYHDNIKTSVLNESETLYYAQSSSEKIRLLENKIIELEATVKNQEQFINILLDKVASKGK